jgi:hypothetical protein
MKIDLFIEASAPSSAVTTDPAQLLSNPRTRCLPIPPASGAFALFLQPVNSLTGGMSHFHLLKVGNQGSQRNEFLFLLLTCCLLPVCLFSILVEDTV